VRVGPSGNHELDLWVRPLGRAVVAGANRHPVTSSTPVLLDLVTPASALRPKAPKRKRPRRHQAEAIRAGVKGFASHDRGQMIMACGTGKTLTALLAAERPKAERRLVLVPSLSLLAQTIREWTANAEFDYLPVCSCWRRLARPRPRVDWKPQTA
jgi:hypothetical protein